MARTILILDFLNFAHRSYHTYGQKGMTTPDGRLSGLAYGLLSMGLGIIREIKPEVVAVCFESKTPTFRKVDYPDYKGTRKESDEDLRSQLAMANIATGRMGWARYRADRHEADDALLVVALEALRSGFDHAYIATGDKDLMGAVSDRISLISMGGGIGNIANDTYTPAMVEAKFGVPPELIADWKALVGDSGDNYPGVPGIGEKAAPLLLQKWGSFEGIYEHLDEVSPAGVQAKLRAGEAAGRMSLHLARLRTDCDLEPPFDPQAGIVGGDDRAATIAYLESLGMRSLISRLPAPVAGRASASPKAGADLPAAPAADAADGDATS